MLNEFAWVTQAQSPTRFGCWVASVRHWERGNAAAALIGLLGHHGFQLDASTSKSFRPLGQWNIAQAAI
jgi:hypothetical protein